MMLSNLYFHLMCFVYMSAPHRLGQRAKSVFNPGQRAAVRVLRRLDVVNFVDYTFQLLDFLRKICKFLQAYV